MSTPVRFALWFTAGSACCGGAIGLMMLAGAGADLARAMLVATGVFVGAGLIAGRRGHGAAVRVAGVVLGATATIAGLALAGVAFNTLPWSGSIVATAALAAAAGAIAARRWSHPARVQAVGVVAVAIGIVVGAGIVVVPRLMRSAAIDRATSTLPPLALAGDDGAPIDAATWTGKVVVLAFWATWCKPCRDELPELERLQSRYRDDARVVLLSVNAGTGGDTPAAAREFARANRWTLPLAFSPDGTATAAVGISGLPALLVVDRSGRVRLTHRGYDRSEGLAALLATEIDQLLAEP